MSKLNVKKNDTVVVLTGKDAGKTGKVLSTVPSKSRVLVSGVNIQTHHNKPKNQNDKGGIVKAEGTIDVSNVQVVCPACNKATRIAKKDVDGKMVRVCKKCGATLDAAKSSSKKSTKSKAEKPAKAQ